MDQKLDNLSENKESLTKETTIIENKSTNNSKDTKVCKRNLDVQTSQILKDEIADIVTAAFNNVMHNDAQLIGPPLQVRGFDFAELSTASSMSDSPVNYIRLFDSLRTTGLQATNFALACDEINRMIECKKSVIDLKASGLTDAARSFESIRERIKHQPRTLDDESTAEIRNNNIVMDDYYSLLQRTNCTIFLGYTSNMISSGVRESIHYLVKHKMVDCLVTTAGGIEEDFMKCMAPAYMGRFEYDGIELRRRGLNRIGNMVVPNDNYRLFENWLLQLFDTLLDEQKNLHVNWTPSKLINRLGKEIDNEESVYYWAYRNNIPVFCPAITDGAIGDTLFYFAFKHPGLRLDLVEDIQRMNLLSLFAINTGCIILGGGTSKHHILNANCMRNGTDFCVFINTGQEFDGSDTGAKPEEALSWAKIRPEATPVKIYGEASIIFPLIVAQTFAKNFFKNK